MPVRERPGGVIVGGAPGQIDPDADRLARVALHWLVEPGHRTVWSMVRTIGAPATLDRLMRGDTPDDKLRAAVLARAAVGDARRLAEATLKRTVRLGARVVVPTDDEWPEAVDSAGDPRAGGKPAASTGMSAHRCAYGCAAAPALHEALDRSVAVVGARAATSYGVHVTTEISGGLAERGWTVVSGGAFGIDAAAHRAALSADGPHGQRAGLWRGPAVPGRVIPRSSSELPRPAC